jgi:hypothetical protein
MERHEAETIIVVEWDAAVFHQQVASWEALGYRALLDTYEIQAEIDPETGEVRHQHTIVLEKSDP